MLGFTFTIHENPDNGYGHMSDGKWTGMVAEVTPHLNLTHPHVNQVMNGTADIALADMTITTKRSLD